METIGKRLIEEIQEFTSGSGDAKSIDRAIATAQELLENLFIIRYKAYEAGLFKPVTEDFPEIDLAKDNESATTDLFSDEAVNQDHNIQNVPKEETTEFPLSKEQEQETMKDIDDSIEHQESLSEIVENVTVESDSEGQGFQAEIPMGSSDTMDLMEIISQSYGKHEKIDKLNGNYSLKEKITFINDLFKGSSDSFGAAIKQIDANSSIQELMPTLNYLSVTNEWVTANQDTLKKFIEKVVAKYA